MISGCNNPAVEGRTVCDQTGSAGGGCLAAPELACWPPFSEQRARAIQIVAIIPSVLSDSWALFLW